MAYKQSFRPHHAFDEKAAKFKYVCKACGGNVWSNHAEPSVSRFINKGGAEQDDIEVRGYGLGTWHCEGRCQNVKVQRKAA